MSKNYNHLDDSDEMKNIVFDDDDSGSLHNDNFDDGMELKNFSGEIDDGVGGKNAFVLEDDDDSNLLDGDQLKEGDYIEDSGERFSYSGNYRDKWVAIGFLVNLAVHLILTIVGASMGSTIASGVDHNDDHDDDDGSSDSKGGYWWRGFTVIGSALLAFLIFAIGFVQLLRRYPEQIIYTSFIGVIICFIIESALFFYVSAYGSGAICIVVALLIGASMFFWRKKILFAKYMLGTVAMLIQRYQSIVWLSYGSIIPSVLFWFYWVISFTFTLNLGWACAIYQLFVLYWVQSTIDAIIQVTSSGTVATWYFAGYNHEESATTITWNAFKRACTTSFGSAAFAALVVSIFKLLRSILNGSCCRICCKCAERIARYFNRYAIAQIAIYGKDFISSAKSTYELFTRSGISAIVNDDITHITMFFTSLSCGLFASLVGGITAYIVNPFSKSDEFFDAHYWYTFVWVWACLFIGIVLMQFLVAVVNSSVVTLFVCFAESPDTLKQTDCALYERFRDHYSDKCDLFTSEGAGVVTMGTAAVLSTAI